MKNNKGIQWKNIYYMLCYCVDELQYFNEGLIKQEDVTGIHDLLAQLLVNSFELLYRNGYIKKYRSETVTTSKPHGRIDIAESIRTGVYAKGSLVCHIDTLDSNNKINQIIKAAFNVLILSNSKIDEKISENIMTYMYKYRDMLKHVDNIEVSHQLLNQKIDIPEWYKPIFAVCKMILNDWLALDESGNIRLLDLNDKERLCYIWEKFLRAFIRKEYPEYIVTKPVFYTKVGKTRHPDIVVIDDKIKKLLILDAKWYNSKKETVDNTNELYMNCSISQNEENYGMEYNVTGLNIYASDDKCKVLPTEITDNNGIVYSDSFVSVNSSIDELEEQIHWVVNQGFNLVFNKEIEYME